MIIENEIEVLAEEIAKAAKKSFLQLFENKESFYYCTLVTTGEGLPPVLSAWSWEALEREATKLESYSDKRFIKWSYADSPYLDFASDNFQDVRTIFSKRIQLTYEVSCETWNKEFNIRLAAMELAMKLLDTEGIFELNQTRDQVCILAEVMPPDHGNTKIALRLNDRRSKIMQEWLAEVAE